MRTPIHPERAVALATLLVAAAGSVSVAAERLSVRSRCASPEEIGGELLVTLEATSAGGPLDAFIIALRFPRELEVVDFRPAGAWLANAPPHLVRRRGTRIFPGPPGLALLAVGPRPAGGSFPLAPRLPPGDSRVIAELVIRIAGGTAPGEQLDFEIVADAAGPGNAANLKTSLVLEGQDFYPGAAGEFRLALEPGTLTVTEERGGFRRGDADATGRVDIADAIFTLNWLFRGGRPPPCLDAADANDDAGANLSDPVFTLNWLFLGGRVPPAPGPFCCAPDPTPDGFPSCDQPPCL